MNSFNEQSCFLKTIFLLILHETIKYDTLFGINIMDIAFNKEKEKRSTFDQQ